MDMRVLSPPGRVKVHSYLPSTSRNADFVYYTEKNIDSIPQLAGLPADIRFDMKAVAQVLPFKVNRYITEELIDWNDLPDDPIYQLTFPQRGMLPDEDFETIASLLRKNASQQELRSAADAIRLKLNPHPAGQTTLNIPHLDGNPVQGAQHKYRETVLFFPASGQTCHAYCTFCFRWAQFTGMTDLRFAAKETGPLKDYLRKHQEVTNVLITGGDPMVMKTSVLERYIEPLLDPALDSLHSIRFGTKAIAYRPQRFVTDADADALLRLFERIVATGRHVAVMAHFNHYRELETPVAREAVRRIRNTGAVIRAQSPVLAHINDDAAVWELLWREQVRLGIIPYYMFVERDTGAKQYFSIPLAKTYKIFREAYKRIAGLGRTVRGPSMSATPGKIEIAGITEIAGEKVFMLRFLQGRNPDWVGKPFFARYNPEATWIDELEPAFGESRFFYEDEMDRLEVSQSA